MLISKLSQPTLRHYGLIVAGVTILILSLIIYSMHVVSTIYLYSRFQNAMILFYNNNGLASEFQNNYALSYFPHARKITLNRSLTLLSDLEKYHFQAAIKLIDERLSIPQNLSQPLVADINKAIELESEVSAFNSATDGLQQKHQLLAADFRLIKKQLRILLDLSDESEDDNLKLSEKDFYSSSLLDSFPLLSEYPDGIKDQQVLNRAFERKLKNQGLVSDDKSIKLISKSLESLRTQSFELKHHLIALKEDEKKIFQKKLEKELVLQNLVHTMRGHVLEIISARTRPKFPNSYYSLYDILTKCFPNLPSVRTPLLNNNL